MARNVFYSFHYGNDINRVMVVRHRWVTYGNQTVSGIIDHAEFMELQQKGNDAIYKWIDEQLLGTSATVVLIGAETLERPFVKYEICQSLNRGNAIVGVYINRIGNLYDGKTSRGCDRHTIIGYDSKDNSPLYFDEIADGIYDYKNDNGYMNLNTWVEKAVNRKRLTHI